FTGESSAACCGSLGPRCPSCGASAFTQLFSAALWNKAPGGNPSTAAAHAEPQPDAAQYHKMTLRSESLLQLVSAARLMTGQPLHFYDRQGEKDFGSSFTQDRQQARSECGETRDPRGFARGWTNRGIQRRAYKLTEHRRQRLQG